MSKNKKKLSNGAPAQGAPLLCRIYWLAGLLSSLPLHFSPHLLHSILSSTPSPLLSSTPSPPLLLHLLLLSGELLLTPLRRTPFGEHLLPSGDVGEFLSG